jgi:hypothetical protein
LTVQQVSRLTRLVRGDVSSLSRRLLAALITIDVHSRDIVSSLLSKGTSSTQDFEWQMQLRYYWEEDDLVVRQVRRDSARYTAETMYFVYRLAHGKHHGCHGVACELNAVHAVSHAAGMHQLKSGKVISSEPVPDCCAPLIVLLQVKAHFLYAYEVSWHSNGASCICDRCLL